MGQGHAAAVAVFMREERPRSDHEQIRTFPFDSDFRSRIIASGLLLSSLGAKLKYCRVL